MRFMGLSAQSDQSRAESWETAMKGNVGGGLQPNTDTAIVFSILGCDGA